MRLYSGILFVKKSKKKLFILSIHVTNTCKHNHIRDESFLGEKNNLYHRETSYTFTEKKRFCMQKLRNCSEYHIQCKFKCLCLQMKNINKLLAGYHDFTLKTQKKSQFYHIPFKKVGTLFLTLQKFVVSLKNET